MAGTGRYEGLTITPIDERRDLGVLYDLISRGKKPIVLMTDEHAHQRPVLFDGPVLGGLHFLEARQQAKRLEIVSSVIVEDKLGAASAQEVGIFDILSKDPKRHEIAGLFDDSGGRRAFVYTPNYSGYRVLMKKFRRTGLVKWATKHPYGEPVRVAAHEGGGQRAE